MQIGTVVHHPFSLPLRQPARAKSLKASQPPVNRWQPGRRNFMALAAAAVLHGAAVWWLMHAYGLSAQPQAKRELSVQVVIGEKPFTPALVPRPLRTPHGTLPRSAALPLPVPVPELPMTTADTPVAMGVQAPAMPQSAAPAASADAVPTTAAPPPPKPVAASALRYRLEPAIAVPPLSRRLNESGQVLLRVVFDVTGAPVQVDLAKSSGFARLDEQAVQAMRAARIQPVLENGRAIAVSATAVLSYDLD